MGQIEKKGITIETQMPSLIHHSLTNYEQTRKEHIKTNLMQ